MNGNILDVLEMNLKLGNFNMGNNANINKNHQIVTIKMLNNLMFS